MLITDKKEENSVCHNFINFQQELTVLLQFSFNLYFFFTWHDNESLRWIIRIISFFFWITKYAELSDIYHFRDKMKNITVFSATNCEMWLILFGRVGEKYYFGLTKLSSAVLFSPPNNISFCDQSQLVLTSQWHFSSSATFIVWTWSEPCLNNRLVQTDQSF